MWFLLLLCIAHIEPVDLQGINRLILRTEDKGNPCEGLLEIYHNNTWGYVGDTNWDLNTEAVVCKSTHCGTKKTSRDITRSKDKSVWLDEMKCEGHESQLWDCKNPGFGASIYPQDQTKWIECSENIKISLDEFQCAGVVKYTGNSGQGYICGDTWEKDEADVLCESLNCSTSEEIPKQYWPVPPEFKNSPKMVVNCSGIEGLRNLWHCATQLKPECSNPATVICKAHKRLQLKGEPSNVCRGELQVEEKTDNWPRYRPEKIEADVWCNQMHCGTNGSYDADGILECSDNVSVTLMDGGKQSKCYGEVHITKNHRTYPVCATTWSKEDAKVVCEELNCGKVVSTGPRKKTGSHGGIMDNVQCSGSESSLWHCRAKRINERCSAIAYVNCAGSIDVNLVDSPGECAGRVEIMYEGKWQRVTEEGWTDKNSNSVCQKLNCGAFRSVDTGKFSQGSGGFLDKTVNCLSDNSEISDCIEDKPKTPTDKAVMITCKEHKLVFLKGQCSGKVGIEYDGKTFWLSGNNKMWNKKSADAVCRQMHCGNALTHNSKNNTNPRGDGNVWRESYNCSSDAKSLFECDKEAQNQTEKIATVTCSGKITVNLTMACWGNVGFCVGGDCGGVCNDTWTKDKSEMLCKNLHCGEKVHDGYNPLKDIDVQFKSVHTAKDISNLKQGNIVRYDKKDSTCKPAYVVCSGSVKARMNTTGYKCSGDVQLEYEGKWLPVCMDALNDRETQNMFCEQQQCGQSVKRLDLGPNEEGARAISQIKCSGKKSLKECEITASNKACTLGGLRCSSWRKMEVKFKDSCSGYVYVYSEGKKSAVSSEGWTKAEGNRLCKDLNCGKFVKTRGEENTMESFWNGNFSCPNSTKPENIWDCEDRAPPSTKKQQQQQLYIECEGEPNVSLSRKCSGEVKINNISVCQSDDKAWDIDYSHLVCKQLGCSNALYFDTKKPNQDVQKYQHVRCEDYHGKLGQCNRFEGKCKGGLVSVYCVKSVEFKTSKSCGGEIEFKYHNDWEKVCLVEFPLHLKDELCKSLNCTRHISSSTKTSTKQETLNWALDCNKDFKDIKHCVKRSEKKLCIPAEIYCKEYEPPPPPTEEPKPIPMVPTILGVGLTLILVILIVVFVRVCIVRRAKRPMYVPSRTFERDEVEFESGDYEDVTGKANEMKALSHGMFRPNADFITESDGRSNTSLPYDDIDEVVEAQPQTSPDATAADSGDKFFREGALDQNGVTYEVDDPQENYDDIEASPEVSETKAEVHNSPQTTPESVAVAPSGSVRGEEDYLVPGQDG
ncbi:scavenger receptor cysteine-rich type 1 protein M160 [Pagrus major]|uniref:scavenger receptor cysteine-rich type 1 protein M160 n=1 Tax=Pagrus major TaxID=143350 RepID=UPI003CC8CF1C